MTTTRARAPGVGAVPPLPDGHQHLVGALRSEWTKLRSVRSTMWCAVALVAGGIGIGILAAASQASAYRRGGIVDQTLFDPTGVSLTGLLFGQLAIGVLGVLVVSAEYGTGTIRATLAAVPRRYMVLAAKVTVFAVVVTVASEAVSFVAFFIGQAVLSGSAPTASLAQPGVARAVVGGGLYLTVIGLLALGLATLIRHTAGTIFAFVAIQLILPLVVAAFPAKYGHPVGRFLPSTIGSAITATTSQGAHASFLPAFAPWRGFALLCGYAALVLVAGGGLMVRRDA